MHPLQLCTSLNLPSVTLQCAWSPATPPPRCKSARVTVDVVTLCGYRGASSRCLASWSVQPVVASASRSPFIFWMRSHVWRRCCVSLLFNFSCPGQVVHLKRFNAKRLKLQDNVDVPLKLDMAPWCDAAALTGPPSLDLPPLEQTAPPSGDPSVSDDAAEVVAVTPALYHLQVR